MSATVHPCRHGDAECGPCHDARASVAPGDRVVFEARALRDAEARVYLDGRVTEVVGDYVQVAIAGSGRMRVARWALYSVTPVALS